MFITIRANNNHFFNRQNGEKLINQNSSFCLSKSNFFFYKLAIPVTQTATKLAGNYFSKYPLAWFINLALVLASNATRLLLRNTFFSSTTTTLILSGLWNKDALNGVFRSWGLFLDCRKWSKSRGFSFADRINLGRFLILELFHYLSFSEIL